MINKKDFRGVRVFKSNLVDSFQVWGKLTRRSEHEAIYGSIGSYEDKERNPVFNRPGLYHDRVAKTAWYEIETRPGVIRAFTTSWEHEEWVWDTLIAPGDRVMNRAEFEEMKRVFSLYDVPRKDRPAIYKASKEYWHKIDMQRDFNLHILQYDKKHGTLKERIAKRIKDKTNATT